MKILIVGPAWLGDMVIAHALVRCCGAPHRGGNPPAGAASDRAARGANAGRCRRRGCCPWGTANSAGACGATLRRSFASEGFAQAIVLPNSFKSALVPFFAAIPRRTGWRGEWRYGLLNDMRVPDAAALPEDDRSLRRARRRCRCGAAARQWEPQLTAEPGAPLRSLRDLERRCRWRRARAVPGRRIRSRKTLAACRTMRQ